MSRTDHPSRFLPTILPPLSEPAISPVAEPPISRVAEPTTISRVGIKTLPFWRNNPKLWFVQLEAQFCLANITEDETKFFHVISAVDSEVLNSVSDIVLKHPEGNKYETLKARLISTHSESTESKIRTLLQGLDLGDQRPSQLLTRMRMLSSDLVGEQLLKSLWLGRLPTSTQTVLVALNEDLDGLAAVADRINDLPDNTATFQVNTVTSPTDSRLRILEEKVFQLTTAVEKVISWSERRSTIRALKWLRGTGDVQFEMDEMRAEFEGMKIVPKVTLKDMFNNIVLRKPLIIAVVMMLSQQFSGINAVIFYSTDIFRNAGLSNDAAIYATLGMGSVNVLMTLVSMVLVERAGRKTLHLIGLAGMMIITLVLTISLALTPSAAWLSYVSVLCIIGFITMFASGPGSIPWFLVAEIFGQGARPIATSIAVSVNWMANFVVSLAFLPVVDSIGEYTFLIFTALLAMFWLFTYNKVPETKGRTIEEVTAEFREK